MPPNSQFVQLLKRHTPPHRLWLIRRMCMCHSTSNAPSAPARQILPTDVAPRHYRVFLDPDLPAHKYKGKVEIDLEVTKPTNKVSLNASHLKLSQVFCDQQKALSESHDEDSSSYTFTFEKTLEKGTSATLKLDFAGELNDQLAGFYRSVHKDDNGVEHVVATTQMEATDCRRAFPCFDEPALKATFDVSILADKKYTVLSNMDVKSTEEKSGKVLTTFNTTPKMSTYLVAFIVGEMKYVESNKFRVPVRVYATPGLEQRCQFSADLAARTLGFFEETFGIEYPLPKCDMVGVHDFSAGAMENWGLITYRVVDLFYTEGKDSLSTKTRVAEVVQHELAHQWFGNLVTMEWWDGLWLNEGFATWMSWYSCNHFFPEWKVWESYVSDAYQKCLSLDGLRSSHPIQVPVGRADEISQIFDAISYLKGSCVIRMVSKYLGEDVFIKGIAKYLKRHQYGNITTDDLWRALSEVSGKDVKGQMDVWTSKVGYPIVTVERVSDSEVKLTQNRFLATGDVKAEEDNTLYPIFLGVRKADGSVDHTQVLAERSTTVKVEKGQLFKLNANHDAVFRTLYPEEHLKLLAAEGAKGDSGILSTEDRIGLMSDLVALSGSYSSTVGALEVINAWKNESSENVWSIIVSFLSEFQRAWVFEDPKVCEAIKRQRENIVVPLSKKIGYEFSEDAPVKEKKLKSLLFSAAVFTDNPEYVSIALKIFAGGFDTIKADLRDAVFYAAAKHGSKQDWDLLFEHYKQGTHGASGNVALSRLGVTKDLALKQKVLDSILDGTIRSQDCFFANNGVAGSGKEGLELSWKFLVNNWDALAAKFPPSLGFFSRFVAVGSLFTKKEQLQEFTEFFDKHDKRGIDQQINTSKNLIQKNINWLARDSKDVEAYLTRSGFLN